jgi:hypothetical protein
MEKTYPLPVACAKYPRFRGIGVRAAEREALGSVFTDLS